MGGRREAAPTQSRRRTDSCLARKFKLDPLPLRGVEVSRWASRRLNGWIQLRGYSPVMSTATASPPGVSFSHEVMKPWGRELVFTPSNLPYTGKVLYVKGGHRLSLQIHDLKQESMMLLSGTAVLQLEDETGTLAEIEMVPGMGYVVQPGRKHRLIAISDVEVVEASTPEVGTTIRVEDDFGRPDELLSLGS